MNALSFKTIGQIMDEGHIWDENFAKHNRIEDGCLVLDIRDGPATYEILLSRVKSYRDLCDWTRQLGEKTWMEKDRLLGIMALLSKACNLPY